jgi:pimeloyl-ACP methyl ester carboxylesterase
MKLHVRESGTGDKVAVLIHGFNCDSGDWWELTPHLLERGYRVQALDLRGHGESARADSYTIADYAADVVETVAPNPEVIIGHSLGARVTAEVVDPLRPARAIYLDPPWSQARADAANLFPDLDSIARMSDEELAATLRHDFPAWSERAVQVDVQSWRRWDPATAVLLQEPRLRSLPETAIVPSLAIAAELDTVFDAEDHDEARRRGFEVRLAPGLTHSLFRDDFDLVLSLITDWL